MAFSTLGRRGVPLAFPNESLQQPLTYFTIVSPATTPVTLLEVKEHLKMQDVVADDANLLRFIAAATLEFERLTNRILINTGFETFVDFFTMSISLRRSILQVLDSFEYLVNGVFTPVPPADFYTTKESDYSRVIFNTIDSMPQNKDDRLQAVRIQFTAGFGATDVAVPVDIKVALLQHITAMNENRGDCTTGDCSCIAVPAAALAVYGQYEIAQLSGQIYRGGGGFT